MFSGGASLIDDLKDELMATLDANEQVIGFLRSQVQPERTVYSLQNLDGTISLAGPLHTKALILTALLSIEQGKQPKRDRRYFPYAD